MEKEYKELIATAERPVREALRLHGLYRGKIEIVPKCPVKGLEDFAIWYTPGVAEVSKEIAKNRKAVYEYTNRGNTVAIISDGTRVLGLGDIGPEGALPVMEGKALLFKYLGGVDAFPLVLRTKDEEEIIKVCKAVEPSFGGINLEDIEKPKCFSILKRLINELDIPVWHDDQQGTATVILAGLINALKVVGKDREKVTITMIGAGAANTAAFRLLTMYGIPPGNIIMVDSGGILNRDRVDLRNESEKWNICILSNKDNRKGGIEEALEGSDVCIALSRSGPDVIKKEWVKRMNNDAIVFACANPVPEIWPWDAKDSGARIVATGRSDFPNQVNNSLCFPGLFRGVFDVGAKAITDEMCIAVAEAIAEFAVQKGLREDYIIPGMDETDLYVNVAVTAGMSAIEQGIASRRLTKEELFKTVSNKIVEARREIESLVADKQ